MTNEKTEVSEQAPAEIAGTGAGVRLEPLDDGLSRFVVKLAAGKGAAVASRRKAERKFSAAGALRYTRDQLNQEQVTVDLKPRKGGQ